ncbi:HHR200Wp [Eremothecium sinecaudum]|uniref:HHR200Wp n=1 Tax=Eremothecium sinecaudum TaxID=45286 RepID=A0A0X8HWV4_9SACH|nr:HHR200Wp [Eremothecium sinecaudum]AMD22969.1 HHR200Wp [Eremothecium sinecaudum]
MGEFQSLDQLPLNIIFQILTYLSIQDLRNVSQTCKTLRVLCNESIAYNKYMKDPACGNQWSGGFIHHLLAMYNDEGLLCCFPSKRATSETLRYVQSCMRLGSLRLITMLGSLRPGSQSSVKRAGGYFISLDAGDDDNESYKFGGDITYFSEQEFQCYESIEDASAEPGDQEDLEANGLRRAKDTDMDMEPETCRSSSTAPPIPSLLFKTSLKKMGMTNGFYQPAYLTAFPSKLFKELRQREAVTEGNSIDGEMSSDLRQPATIKGTPSKRGTRRFKLGQNGEEDNFLGDDEHETDADEEDDRHRLTPSSRMPANFNVSPRSSNGGSDNSIFSDLKLTDSEHRAWTMGFELDPLSDSTNELDSGSSRSFLKKLQNPMRVREKAVLFDMLLNKEDKPAPPKAPASGEGTKRKLRDNYMREIDRHNSKPALTARTIAVFDNEKCLKGRYEDLWQQKEATDTDSTPTIRRKRKQLKAFVTDGNKICYERI